jgi:hypothetical protein
LVKTKRERERERSKMTNKWKEEKICKICSMPVSHLPNLAEPEEEE